jgi:hypothetical protein
LFYVCNHKNEFKFYIMNKTAIMTVVIAVIALFVFFALVKPLADKTASKVYKDFDPMKSRNI